MPINSVALANTFNEFRTTVNEVITTVNEVSGGSGVINANTLIGGTVTANNLTSGRVTLATTSGQLTDDSALTYDTSTDILTLAGTTDASSSTTGTLKVAGGLGVAKKLYVGTDLAVTANTTLSGTTDASSTTTGTLTVAGGVGIAKKLYVGTDLAVTANTTLSGATDASSSTTGAVIITGGVGIAKKLYVGTDLAVTGNTTLSGATDASSSTTGTLTVAGGVGIAKKLYVGTDLNVVGNSVFNGNVSFLGSNTIISTTVVNIEDNILQLSHLNPSDIVDIGFIGGYNNGANVHSGLFRDATDDTWKLFRNYTAEPSTTIDVSANGFAWANLAIGALSTANSITVATGQTYKVNNVDVLSATTLGSSVVTSSLTSVGTIGTGVWQGTLIDPTYGGTGVNNGVKTVTLGGNLVTSGAFNTTLTATANTTVTLPTSGTLVGSADTGTVTSTMIADGTIVNGDINASAAIAVSKLASSAVTVGTTAITLGTSSTTLAGLTSVTSTSFVGALTGNASTVTTNANLTGHITSVGNAAVLGSFTSAQLLAALTDETGTGANVFANTPTLVAPLLGTPTSGNLANCTFPTLNQNTTGNASTATTLQTARAINGVSFDGSAAITVTAAAGTLSGATLSSGVTASSLTSVGTISSGVWNGSSISTTYTDAKVTSIVAGTNISLSGATGAVTVNVSGTVAAATTATNQSGGTVSATTGAFSGQVTQSGDSATIHGPNSTWGAYLQVGGNGRTVSGALYASVAATNGNLHIDSGSDKAMYLNYYGGTSGINFGSGSSSIVGTMTAAGALTMTSFSGAGTGLTGTASSLSIGGNSATVGNFTPSATAGVANRVVVADASGYINNTYFNSSDSSAGSGVTAVMVKTGSNYLYSGTAAAVATFLSGQSMNISGSATSAPLLSGLGNYVWSASTAPASYSLGIQSSFVSSTEGFPNYGSVMTMNTYSGGGGALQMYVPYGPNYGGTGLQVRFGNYDAGNVWTSFKTLLASDNYNSYAPTLTGTGASGTWSISVTGNSGTVGGFTPSASAGVGSRVVVADGSGYIHNSYFNSTDDTGSSTVSYIMAKFGDNYIRSASAAKVATFISGQSMNISGTATGLSATLAVASGGTGTTTLASNNVLLGNGTSAVQVVAPSTSGNVLTSNGTTWTSAAAAGGITWSTKTANYTAVNGDYLFCDTSSGAFTITLPASPSTNHTIYIQDAKGTFQNFALTVARNGNTIMRLAEDLIAGTNNVGFGLAYNGSDWRIF